MEFPVPPECLVHYLKCSAPQVQCSALLLDFLIITPAVFGHTVGVPSLSLGVVGTTTRRLGSTTGVLGTRPRVVATTTGPPGSTPRVLGERIKMPKRGGGELG